MFEVILHCTVWTHGVACFPTVLQHTYDYVSYLPDSNPFLLHAGCQHGKISFWIQTHHLDLFESLCHHAERQVSEGGNRLRRKEMSRNFFSL